MSPAERADKVRALHRQIDALLPPGSVILTADEWTRLRGMLEAAWEDDQHRAIRLALDELFDANDQAATR